MTLLLIVMQVWFQNRRAKFRRNERSILAQRTQLQQFSAANVSRKCASSSPSQLIDDLYHRQLRHPQHLQQQQRYMMESTVSAVCSVSQSVSTSTSWQGGPLTQPPHYVQSAAPSSTTDLLYSTVAPAVAPLSAGGYSSSTTDNGVFQQRPSVDDDDDDDDDRLQSTAVGLHQRLTDYTPAYTTQTTTNF